MSCEEKQLLCPHLQFRADVAVSRIEDKGRFMADVRIECADCGLPFSFNGLPAGLDVEGAACSFDGLEGRFSIVPGAREPVIRQLFRV